MMPTNLDEWAELLLTASNLMPLFGKLKPLIAKLGIKVGGGDKTAQQIAEEQEKLFQQTLTDENFLEQARGLLLAKEPVADRNLSLLIQDLNPAERTALRRLIFAGYKPGKEGEGSAQAQVVILMSLASRGPDVTAMRKRLEEMSILYNQAQEDPMVAVKKIKELWEKIRPQVEPILQRIFDRAIAEYAGAKTSLGKKTPLKTLLFLDGFSWPSKPTTTTGWIKLVAAILAVLVFLAYGFTPER